MPEEKDIKDRIHAMGAQAVEAARLLAQLLAETKNRIRGRMLLDA